MEIVKMTKAHIAAVAQIERECFSDPWSENAVAYELRNPLSLWLVAMDGENLVGYVGSQSVIDDADMMNLAVSGSYRRQGVAESLVETLIMQLKEQGVHSLTLEVRLSNEPAKALYEKLGFMQVGRRPNYYRNPKEDALILRKEWDA